MQPPLWPIIAPRFTSGPPLCCSGRSGVWSFYPWPWVHQLGWTGFERCGLPKGQWDGSKEQFWRPDQI